MVRNEIIKFLGVIVDVTWWEGGQLSNRKMEVKTALFLKSGNRLKVSALSDLKPLRNPKHW